MKVVECKNLSKRYRNGRGAFDVNLTLEEGQVFGLLGANGAGKTTVMKILAGLIHPTQGSVQLFGIDDEEFHAKAMREVGTLIEAPAFYGYLTARENMKLAANFYPEKNIDEADISAALEEVGLLAFEDEKTSRYSLGMKQRFGLAIAMLHNPKLYILDEPSNGLDIEGRVDIRRIITGLAARTGATFMICSHLSDEIQRSCDSVGIMKDGKLLCIEDMENILNHYPSLEDYYLEMIGAQPKERPTLELYERDLQASEGASR